MLGFSSWFYFCAKRWSAAFGWQRMNWTRPSGLTMWGRKSKSSGTISKVRNALSLHNFVSNQSFGNVLGWSERARIKLTWGVINLYQSISETAATTVSRDLSFYVKQKNKSIATTNGELQNFCTIFSATESGVIHNFCQFSALCRLTIFFIQSINFCRGERGNLWHFVWGISDRVWVLMISDDCWFITI